MKGRILGVLSCLLVMVGAVFVSTASAFIFYEPKIPKTLKK